jgi:hypothetical protein
MPASVNKIKKTKKGKPVDKPGETIHRSAEPIHGPPLPLLTGSERRHRRRYRIHRWGCTRSAQPLAKAAPPR